MQQGPEKIMTDSESPRRNVAQVISEKDAFLVDKSIKELKDLRLQLHYAADYCESSFLKSKQKDQVLENTKAYLCRAVITVVDHLGSASANLDKIISQDKTVPEAELKLDCLSQRLLACKQFSHQSALADMCWNPRLPGHHSRYLLAELPYQGNNFSNTRSNYAEAKMKISGDVEGGMDSSEVNSGAVVQKWPKVENTGFQFQIIPKPRRTKLVRVSFHRRSELLSLIRGPKRIPRVN